MDNNSRVYNASSNRGAFAARTKTVRFAPSWSSDLRVGQQITKDRFSSKPSAECWMGPMVKSAERASSQLRLLRSFAPR